MPQAPLRPFQAPDCRVGEARLGRARAEAAGGLQGVLEAHRGVPPIQHRRGVRQDLALQLPEAGIAVAQHRRGRLRVHARRGECPPERLGRGHLAVADIGETVLGAVGTDHLARGHLEAAPRVPVPVAHVAAVQPDDDRAGRPRRGPVLEFDGVRLHDFRADAQRPVAHRAGVLRPAERQRAWCMDRHQSSGRLLNDLSCLASLSVRRR